MAEMEMEEFESKVDLVKLPKMVKIFLTMFLINMGIGYCLAILNIQVTEGLSYDGISQYYRGNEAKMIYAPEMKEITTTSHTHMLSMSMMFFTMGIVFLFTKTLPKWLKKFVLVDGFGAVIIAVSSFWLIRYVAAPFAALMMLSGMLLGICAFFMVMVPLYEMWLTPYYEKWIKKNKNPDLNPEEKGGN